MCTAVYLENNLLTYIFSAVPSFQKISLVWRIRTFDVCFQSDKFVALNYIQEQQLEQKNQRGSTCISDLLSWPRENIKNENLVLKE